MERNRSIVFSEKHKPYSSHSEYLDEVEAYCEVLLDNLRGAADTGSEDYPAYFESRERASVENGLFIPLAYVAARFGLPLTAKQIFYVALAIGRNPSLKSTFSEEAKGFSRSGFYRALFGMAHDEYALIDEAFDYIGQSFFSSDIGNETFFRFRQVVESFLLGNDYLIPGLAQLYLPQEPKKELLCHLDINNELLNLVKIAAYEDSPRYYVFINGDSKSGKKSHIQRLCDEKGLACCFISVANLLEYRDASPHEAFRDILTYCVLHDAIPVFTKTDCLGNDENRTVFSLSTDLLKLFSIVFFLSTDELIMDASEDCAHIHIDIPLPDRITSKMLWRTYGSTVNSGIDWEVYANKFKFPVGLIKQVVKTSQTIAELKGKPSADDADVKEAAYTHIRHRLGKMASKTTSAYTFDDLVLPDYQLSLLKAACNQVKNKHIVYDLWGFNDKVQYGKGLSMLFSGPPGTGKTMAAQVVASSLNMQLYVVNLSMVVSKYIGETEKNLSELFIEARKSQSIVFFDEADSLFSKRTEVKNSNDKTSNMEASFLLQKMEEQDGIVILCTNFIQNFDEAFKRRLMFVIDFPFPTADYRKKLWEKVFPPGAPLSEDMDLEFIADKFELSGSNIKNIAVNAAFLAAQSNTVISMKEILLSIKQEYAKISKTLSKDDFGQYFVLLE